MAPCQLLLDVYVAPFKGALPDVDAYSYRPGDNTTHNSPNRQVRRLVMWSWHVTPTVYFVESSALIFGRHGDEDYHPYSSPPDV
jgi:hypothetical protein